MSDGNGTRDASESRLDQLLGEWAVPLRLTAAQIAGFRAEAMALPRAPLRRGTVTRQSRPFAAIDGLLEGLLTPAKVRQYVDDLMRTYDFLRSPWWYGTDGSLQKRAAC